MSIYIKGETQAKGILDTSSYFKPLMMRMGNGEGSIMRYIIVSTARLI